MTDTNGTVCVCMLFFFWFLRAWYPSRPCPILRYRELRERATELVDELGVTPEEIGEELRGLLVGCGPVVVCCPHV